MTEEDWLASRSPDRMLEVVGDYPNRKLRLFCVACCRRLWAHLEPPEAKAVVRVAERYADGTATPDELGLAHRSAITINSRRGSTFGAGAAVLETTMAVLYADRCAEGCAEEFESTRGVGHPDEERSQQAGLVRDVFGNPFRSVTFDPSWRTSAAVGLASQMYESRDFGPMPILADALQDAGCASEDMLTHCRDPHGVHVRGCWVVDLVLGKV